MYKRYINSIIIIIINHLCCVLHVQVSDTQIELAILGDQMGIKQTRLY